MSFTALPTLLQISFPTIRTARRSAHCNQQGLTKRTKSTKIGHMNCLDIRIALIISIIHRMVG